MTATAKLVVVWEQRRRTSSTLAMTAIVLIAVMVGSSCSNDEGATPAISVAVTTTAPGATVAPTTATVPADAATATVNVAFTGDANSEVCGYLAQWSSSKLDERALDINDAEALESFQNVKAALSQSIASAAPDAIFPAALGMAAAVAAETQALTAANFDYDAFVSSAPEDALRFIPPENGEPDTDISTVEQYGDEVCGGGEPPIVEIDWSSDPGDACVGWQPVVDARIAIAGERPTPERLVALDAAWTTIASAPPATAPANLGADARAVGIWVRDRVVPLRSKVGNDPRRVLTELTGTERVTVALWDPEIRDAAGRIEAYLATACEIDAPATNQ